MNKTYEQMITVNGKTYRYDPDFDCYYRFEPQSPETTAERWIKIIVASLFLAFLCIITPYLLVWTS